MLIVRKLLVCFFLLLLPRFALAGSGDTYNIRIYPLSLLIGSVSADFDIAVSPYWTVGPSLTYWDFKLDQASGFSSGVHLREFRIGARGNYYTHGVYTDGIYIGPSLDYSNLHADVTDSSGTNVSASVGVLSVTALVGYAWFWNSFNTQLGIGGTLGLGPTHVSVQSASSNSSTDVSAFYGGSLALEWCLGWTF